MTSMHTRTTCRICGGADLECYIDLGDQPPSNSFVPPAEAAALERFPLRVFLCKSCGLSQLLDIVSAESIFGDYAYLSSTSKALVRHYQSMVEQALARFAPAEGALAADIGCNDGITFSGYPKGRCRLLGVEPSSAADLARQAGFEVLQDFFGRALGEKLALSHGRASLLTTTNVLAHVDGIADFCAGVAAWLAPDGVWIVEFPYLVDMIEELYFDTIYHEHLSYLALSPLVQLCRQVGLKIFDVERIDFGASGPALRVFFGRADGPHAVTPAVTGMLAAESEWGLTSMARYRDFEGRAAELRNKVKSAIRSYRDKGEKVGAYCAPAKGNTLLNYFGLGPNEIFAISDNNPRKIGTLAPGSAIPVISDEDLVNSGARIALLLAWNYKEHFLKNAEFIKRGGRFLVPLPVMEVLPP
jgi:hypothetical protein